VDSTRAVRPNGCESCLFLGAALDSVDLDDDLPQGTAFTNVGEGFGDVVEPERAVGVDADVSGDAQLGQRLEVRRPSFTTSIPNRR
jgi:hypothetical protein